MVDLTPEETKGKIKELKIELLKQTLKRKQIKKGIARLLTLKPEGAGKTKQETKKK